MKLRGAIVARVSRESVKPKQIREITEAINAAATAIEEIFLVKDAMTLGDWDERFASVIDSGLFHIYAGDERQRYVQGLAHVLKPGGRLFLFSFNDDASWPGGGVSRQELYDAFADDWDVESLELVGGEVNPAFAAEFPEKFANMNMGSRSSARKSDPQAELNRLLERRGFSPAPLQGNTSTWAFRRSAGIQPGAFHNTTSENVA